MLEGFERTQFTAPVAEGGEPPVTHDLYTTGKGPVVVLIQELPGIGADTIRLAGQLAQSGLTVVMPHLFGPLGRESLVGNLVRVFCLRREFRVLEKRGSSPIVNWLRALCEHLRQQHQVPGVGVIGMCLTGNFAISLMADDAVLAGVASQPSLPLLSQRALHMSSDDIHQIRRRLDQHGPMLAYRFADDRICRAAKFEALDAAFNDDRQRIHLRTLPGGGHSVLTRDFLDADGSPTRAALEEVLQYFADRLPS